MDNITLLWAFIKCEDKDIILVGSDGVEAIRLPYTKISSPSLLSLMDETVRKDDTAYYQVITFDNLTADEIISKIELQNSRR